MADEPKVPGNFSALYDIGLRTRRGLAPARRTSGDVRLSNTIADLQVEYDEATQMPVRVTSRSSARSLAPTTGATPEDAAREFIDAHRDLWHLSDPDLQTVQIRSVSRKGLPTVRLMQQVKGTDVFNSDMTVALNGANQVVSVTGQLFAGADQPVARGLAGQRETPIEEAIATAARDLTSHPFDADEFVPSTEARQATEQYYTFAPSRSEERPALDRDIRTKPVMFPLGDGQFASGYYIELWYHGYPPFAYVLDTIETPDILFRKNLSARAFAYRVHNTGDAVHRPEDGPAPGTPHPTGLPNGFQAPTIAEKLVTLDGLLPGDPWLPPGAHRTDGNNCVAYADLTTGKVPGTISSANQFDHRYNHAKGSGDPQNLQASIVGMFFHVNWLHDRWYEAGFDEASGNAQKHNFGRGGLDNDPILAEGNDRSGHDNANMATPPDGASPRMQMYEFTGCSPLPSRTSNHEALITFHEMGHYITNRLVGNATGLLNQQGGAMGEGWGDLFAIVMTSQATDDFAAGVFAAGGWTDITSTFKQNYYFSIRRYPYSANMARNPLTFKHISAGVALPAGPPRNARAGGSNSEVHNAGEVWCTALWEVFVNLVAAHGHEEAERRMLLYLVGGLKLTPSDPTFTQARDAMIDAIQNLGPEDEARAWQGFAKRGMGKGAQSPPSTSVSLAGVVESFTA
jgi:extracellular elastinolytic metalloproteinase